MQITLKKLGLQLSSSQFSECTLNDNNCVKAHSTQPKNIELYISLEKI